MIAEFTVAVTAALVLAATPAWAQVPPLPDTTFNQSVDTQWVNGSNWSSGVPVAPPGPPDDAKIADGKTAFFDQTGTGEPLFGTLTLGVGSTFQLKAGGNEGIPTGQDVYFSDNSVLEFTAGSSNRDSDFFVLSGANGTWKTTPGTNTFFRGTLQGAGNFKVVMGGNVQSRIEASSFTGHLTYQSNSASVRELDGFGQFGGTTSVGSGGATFADKVFVTQAAGERMHNSATVKFSGAGGAGYKWSTHAGSETIANLIIESPSQSGPYLITGNNTNSTDVRVTDTATFQGTAGTVEIQSRMWGSFGTPLKARDSGVDINANNFLFQGTGNWTINGSKVTTAPAVDPINYAIGSIGVALAGDVTTHTNVTVNAAFDAPTGFTKKGNGTLTLTYLDPVRTVQSGTQNFNPKGIVNVNEGTLAIGGNASLNATSAINVAPGAKLLYNSSTPLTRAPTLNGAGTSSRALLGGTGTINAAVTLNNLGDVLSPGNSPGILPFGVSQVWSSFTYDWETNDWNGNFPGTGVAGVNFDQITIPGTLDLSGTTSGSYLLNILSLNAGNLPGDVVNFDETDQSWTILTATGGITGFDVDEWLVDASGFTNLDEGIWSLELIGNSLVLSYSVAAVPEPHSLALWGVLTVLLVAFGYSQRRGAR